jgi:hypothetical protein
MAVRRTATDRSCPAARRAAAGTVLPPVSGGVAHGSAPDRIRTYDPRLRRPPLCPTELRAQNPSIGALGFEPRTSCSQSRRATELRHAPWEQDILAENRGRVKDGRRCIRPPGRAHAPRRNRWERARPDHRGVAPAAGMSAAAGMAPARARKARARWLRRCFWSRDASPNVRPRSGTRKRGS